MRKLSTLALAGLSMTGGVFLSAVSAQAQTTLRFANWVPEAAQPTPALIDWAHSITEASNGRITFEFFHGGQLGSALDHFNMTRDGVADVTWSVPAYEPARFPISDVTSMPFLSRDAVVGAEVLTEWYSKYGQEEMAEVKFCFATMPPNGTLNFKTEIRTPGQMQGIKVRPVGTLFTEYMRRLGAVPVSLPATEARQAFERGLLEALAFPWRTLYPYGLEKVVTHHQDLTMHSVGGTLVFNKDVYARMSAEDKAVVDEHCTPEWASKVVQIWADWESEGRQMLLDEGHTIYSLTDDEISQWIEPARPMHDVWKEQVKDRLSDPDTALEELLQGMRDAGVGYY